MQTKIVTDSLLKKEPIIRETYIKAFPKNERLPFFRVLRKSRASNIVFTAYYDNECFVGLSYTIRPSKGVLYILYLAIKSDCRGKGYGSKILSTIADENKQDTLFLLIEEVDKQYDDYNARSKREQFYVANGYKKCAFTCDEFGVIFNVLARGGSVTHDQYLTAWSQMLV